ncbi:MAG: LPS export ABC transporter periplasmic protein LptC [Sulfurimonas sp.]|nr:LPS export ABC transporter periplasmic protein LptC [Sulfurimonas sp.]
MIYFLFEPMKLKKAKLDEVPQFSLFSFTLYELDKTGLITLMKGNEAIKYEDRYVIKNIDYSDNSKKYIVNMKAKEGLYKGDTTYLNGDVRFSREDGLSFFSQEVIYNKTTDIAISEVGYVSHMGLNKVSGSKIIYDNKNNTIKSENVYAVYNAQEKN